MFLMTLCLWSSDVVNIHGLDIYRYNARIMAETKLSKEQKAAAKAKAKAEREREKKIQKM